MTKRILLVLLVTLFVANVSAEPIEYPKNKDGSIITGVLTAGFDPLNQEGMGPVYPFPFNLFYFDIDALVPTQDGTLAVPESQLDDPNDFTNPLVALSAMDGFSTTEKWTASFVDHQRNAGSIESGSVRTGDTVRLFQVSTIAGNPLYVTGVVRELQPNVDYMAVSQNDTIAIIPLKALPELSNFLAVLTNGITDQRGNDSTPDQTYYLLKRTTPWVDENGNSTYPLVDDGLAGILELFRPLVNSWEAAAESMGIPREDIVLSWPVQTQGVTPVLKHIRGTVRPTSTVVGPAGLDTSAVGGMGIADIYAGIIDLPYYLGVPSAENPVAPLFDFWKAAPGAYVPPFDERLADKTSTHVTLYNPFPVLTDDQTVPVLMTVPNAKSSHSKPAAGWPVLIFGHGLTGNRSQALAIADTAAAAGYAVIAIDFPLHGITPDDAALAPLYVENTPFAPIANERTFDLDLVNNETGAPGPDGKVDPSGTHIINLQSMLTSRDNLRQGQVDLFTLAANIPGISIDGDTLPDLDGSTILYAGWAMGSIMGTPFVAVEPAVTNAFLSAPAGGIARTLEASPTIGPRIRAGLAAAGVEPGSSDYEQFFILFQTMLESGDPINWAAEASMLNSIVVHEVINDQVIPNYVSTAPLSGTEPLIATMGLKSFSDTQMDPKGVRVAGRFVPPADHASLVRPAASPAATVEMQKQLASFLATRGTTVVVEDAATMVPVAEPGVQQSEAPEKAPPADKQKLTIKKGG